MCQYIKNNGNQCGLEAEPFCHHHDETEQATQWREDKFNSTALCGAQRGFSGVEMETTCDQCETSLRRTERLTEHPNVTRQTTIEAVVQCDCSEYVVATKSVRNRHLPDGWL